MRLLVIAATGCRAILGIDTPGGGGGEIDGAVTGGPTAAQTGSATEPDATTLQIPLGKPVTAGDLIVVAVGADSQITPTFSDSLGNKYNTLSPTASQGSVSSATAFVLASAAGLDTITVTFTTDASFPDVRVVEYTGTAVDPLDDRQTCAGNDTLPTCTVTTHGPDELVVAAMYSSGFTQGGDPAFTVRVFTNLANLVEDRTAATAGTYPATVTLATTGDWIMQIASFRPR